jgi:hypothetical protein
VDRPSEDKQNRIGKSRLRNMRLMNNGEDLVTEDNPT